jgi:SAM-dependent methyltransferase
VNANASGRPGADAVDRVPLTSPFYLARRALRLAIGARASMLRGTILDIGCGTKPYRGLFDNPAYIGLEVNRDSPLGSHRKPDVYYDGRHIPLPDASVESVLCSQVLEHVFEPGDFLAELRRVLVPGGRILLTVPFVWDEHEQPFDYARYSSFGLRHLFESAGFSQLDHARTLAGASIFPQLLLAYAYKVLHPLPRWPRMLLLAGLSLPMNLAGLALEALGSGKADLYLDNVAVFERKP